MKLHIKKGDTVYVIAGGYMACNLLQGTGLAWIAPYVDPAIAICISVGMLPEPVRVLKNVNLTIEDSVFSNNMAGTEQKDFEPGTHGGASGGAIYLAGKYVKFILRIFPLLS